MIFFDDVLVYSRTLGEYLDCLRTVLSVLQAHQLYAKSSKCIFNVKEIYYLGHLISNQGVRADPSKLDSMDQWPIPHTIKSLRGFLGLTDYHRKFIRGYGVTQLP